MTEITHRLEIEYLYKGTTSWFYFSDDSEKLETSIQRAEKHFDKLIRENGWKKHVQLVNIHPMRKANEFIATGAAKQRSTAKPTRRKRTTTPHQATTTTTRKSIVSALEEAESELSGVRDRTKSTTRRKTTTSSRRRKKT